MFTAALLMLAPLAAMASPIARTDATSQRIVLKSNTKQCVTAYGLAPQAGDILAIAPCEEPANQYYLHQFFLTEGIDSTAPVQLASTNLCIDAGSDAPSEYTSLTLQECNGSKQQSWYWFGASELEINNQCWAAVNTTQKSGICAGTQFTQLQTATCKPFVDSQTFTTAGLYDY